MKRPYRRTQRCGSCAVLNLVKLTVRVNHYISLLRMAGLSVWAPCTVLGSDVVDLPMDFPSFLPSLTEK